MLQLDAAKRGHLDTLAARAATLPGTELLRTDPNPDPDPDPDPNPNPNPNQLHVTAMLGPHTHTYHSYHSYHSYHTYHTQHKGTA